MGNRHRIEVLEPSDPVAPQKALNLLVTLTLLVLRDHQLCTMERVPRHLGPHVLTGNLASRHLGRGHLDDLRPGRLHAPGGAGPLQEEFSHAVGPDPDRGDRGRHRDRHVPGFDQLGQTLACQIGGPRLPPGRSRSIRHLHRSTPEVKLEDTQIPEAVGGVHHAHHAVCADGGGFFEHARVGGPEPLAPGVLDPRLLVILPPAPVLVGDEPVWALPTLHVAALAPTVGRYAAAVRRVEAVPPPLHHAESLHISHRLEPHLQTGGEVGHGEPRRERLAGETPVGGLGKIRRRFRHQLSSEIMVVGVGSVTSFDVLTTAVPRERNSMVWLPHWWDFSSRRTPTMPDAPSRSASSCMRVMASSRAVSYTHLTLPTIYSV